MKKKRVIASLLLVMLCISILAPTALAASSVSKSCGSAGYMTFTVRTANVSIQPTFTVKNTGRTTFTIYINDNYRSPVTLAPGKSYTYKGGIITRNKTYKVQCTTTYYYGPKAARVTAGRGIKSIS